MISREDAIDILKEAGCTEEVIAHCIAVSDLALEIADYLRTQDKEVDLELVEIGGLLHDLGRAKSHGIDHAVIGEMLAKEYDLEPSIREVIKRHIGAGITREEALQFGLPDDDYMPVTLEQKIVAHADNLVKGTKRISLETRIRKMEKKGMDIINIQRVKTLAEEIGVF